MTRRGVAIGMVAVAFAGAWWLYTSVNEGASVLTLLATGGVFVGAMVALLGLGGERPARTPLATGFAVIALPTLAFGIVEARDSMLLLVTFVLLFLGAGAAAVGAWRLEARQSASFALMGGGLLLAGAATAVWGIEKLFSPDLDLPPYLIAPLGFFVASYGLLRDVAAGREDGAAPAV